MKHNFCKILFILSTFCSFNFITLTCKASGPFEDDDQPQETGQKNQRQPSASPGTRRHRLASIGSAAHLPLFLSKRPSSGILRPSEQNVTRVQNPLMDMKLKETGGSTKISPRRSVTVPRLQRSTSVRANAIMTPNRDLVHQKPKTPRRHQTKPQPTQHISTLNPIYGMAGPLAYLRHSDTATKAKISPRSILENPQELATLPYDHPFFYDPNAPHGLNLDHIEKHSAYLRQQGQNNGEDLGSYINPARVLIAKRAEKRLINPNDPLLPFFDTDLLNGLTKIQKMTGIPLARLRHLPPRIRESESQK